MEDKFKDFVSANRDDFELYDLDLDQTWGAIESGVEDRKVAFRNKKKLWLKLAASVALLMLFSIALIMASKPQNNEELIFASVPELAEAQVFYTTQINQKMAIAQSIISDQEVFTDIQELDLAFKELKSDLKDNVDNEEVIIAMIENYQLKLKILDRILEELKEDDKAIDASKL